METRFEAFKRFGFQVSSYVVDSRRTPLLVALW